MAGAAAGTCCERTTVVAFETTYTVEWGDCDAAGIVFYPNYFYWLDCTWQRWLRSLGLSQRELARRFGAATPLMDVGCNFTAPVTCDDELVVRATIADWKEKRLRVEYALTVAGRPVARGHELRAWAVVGDNGGLRTVPIDPAFRRLFG